MVEECKADGVPADQLPQLVHPIEAMFQGTRAEILPVHCSCGKDWLGFIDMVNRREYEERLQNFDQMVKYNPNLRGRASVDASIRESYGRPKHRMVLVSKEEFAYRVSLERNHMVREGLERKLTERGLYARPAQPKLAARIAFQ